MSEPSHAAASIISIESARQSRQRGNGSAARTEPAATGALMFRTIAEWAAEEGTDQAWARAADLIFGLVRDGRF